MHTVYKQNKMLSWLTAPLANCLLSFAHTVGADDRSYGICGAVVEASLNERSSSVFVSRYDFSRAAKALAVVCIEHFCSSPNTCFFIQIPKAKRARYWRQYLPRALNVSGDSPSTEIPSVFVRL